MNGYNFTERVRKALMTAREEAMALHHEYVGTEHMLLGICAPAVGVGEGVATAALKNLGIGGDEVRRLVLSTVKRGHDGAAASGPDLPYTNRAKKALELAMSEARNLNHSYVGTEHVLLGLIAEERGIAAQVLTSLGATVNRVRDEVKRLLGPEAATQPTGGDFVREHQPAGDRQAAITLVVEHPDGRIEARKFRNPGDAVSYLAHLEL